MPGEETSAARIEGGYLCGRVRNGPDAEPSFVGVCHCFDGQRFSGSAVSTGIGIPGTTLKLTGMAKTFTQAGDSGTAIQRRFCLACGTGIVEEAEALPDMVMVSAGTLDDRSWAKPTSQIYCESALPWVQLGGEMKLFAKMPR